MLCILRDVFKQKDIYEPIRMLLMGGEGDRCGTWGNRVQRALRGPVIQRAMNQWYGQPPYSAFESQTNKNKTSHDPENLQSWRGCPV